MMFFSKAFILFFPNYVISEDKRCRRKSRSRFSEARKHGRTVLYQLTNHFSRGGKQDDNMGEVRTKSFVYLTVIKTRTAIKMNKNSSLQPIQGDRT